MALLTINPGPEVKKGVAVNRDNFLVSDGGEPSPNSMALFKLSLVGLWGISL